MKTSRHDCGKIETMKHIIELLSAIGRSRSSNGANRTWAVLEKQDDDELMHTVDVNIKEQVT